jgi:hypothetical protein
VRALLDVRARDVPKLPKTYRWTFHTKLQLGVELVRWLQQWLSGSGKELWLAVDGAYAKAPFLKPVLRLGVKVVSRLRKDADLRALPPRRRRPGRRGPLPTYGKARTDLAKRAGQPGGWSQVDCVQYGRKVGKTIKTFLATWRPAGGRIRVVIVREADGWLPFFGTDPQVSAVDILEAMAVMGRRAEREEFRQLVTCLLDLAT